MPAWDRSGLGPGRPGSVLSKDSTQYSPNLFLVLSRCLFRSRSSRCKPLHSFSPLRSSPQDEGKEKGKYDFQQTPHLVYSVNLTFLNQTDGEYIALALACVCDETTMEKSSY